MSDPVTRLLYERARTGGLYVVASGERRSFEELCERAGRLAGGLAALGVGRGDRVVTILPNRIEHVDLIFACAWLGAVHVPVNVFLKGEFLRYQLVDAEPALVVADEAGRRAVEALAVDSPVFDPAELPLAHAAAPPSHVTASDPMAIIYTSGTTGMPKGCVLPYGYHVLRDNSLLEYRTGDVLYTSLPLFHGWARGMLFAALTYGLELHLDETFSASSVLERIVETRATVFSGVGAMGMAMLAQPPGPLDRAHVLRAAFMIPFAPADEARFTERFGVRVQSQMYGQTETGAITFTPLREAGKPGTVGRPSPLYEVRLAADGEILVRPHEQDVMYVGYWNKPGETAEALRGGWHHTGDLGRFDDDGYLVFVDRKKDAIRRRGENVSSVQLEQVISTHPKVAEAAVVGVPSSLSEDDILAILVLEPGETAGPEELFSFFRDHLPYFAIPRYVEVRDELPKTPTMRVRKHELRARGISQAAWDLEQLGLVLPREERR